MKTSITRFLIGGTLASLAICLPLAANAGITITCNPGTPSDVATCAQNCVPVAPATPPTADAADVAKTVKTPSRSDINKVKHCVKACSPTAGSSCTVAKS